MSIFHKIEMALFKGFPVSMYTKAVFISTPIVIHITYGETIAHVSKPTCVT